MALIPVRSKEPVNGERFITEVGEEHLERWPDDYDRLEGEELVKYELRKSDIREEHLDDAAETAAAIAEAGAPNATDAVRPAPTDPAFVTD